MLWVILVFKMTVLLKALERSHIFLWKFCGALKQLEWSESLDIRFLGICVSTESIPASYQTYQNQILYGLKPGRILN
jgi:hypothetical protein